MTSHLVNARLEAVNNVEQLEVLAVRVLVATSWKELFEE